MPPLKHLPPYAPSLLVAECIVIQRTPPPFPPSSANLSIDIICRRVHRHHPSPSALSSPPYSNAVSFHRHPLPLSVVIICRHIHRPLLPCLLACAPLFADLSAAISRLVSGRHPPPSCPLSSAAVFHCHPPPVSLSSAAVTTVICGRIYCHPPPCPLSSFAVSAVIRRRVHCHPPPCSLSSAAVSIVIRRRIHRHPPPPCPSSTSATVILGRRIQRHQMSCPPSSCDVSTPTSSVTASSVISHHVHRHPVTCPSLSSAAMSTVIHCHLRRRFHRYHPPPCHPSSIAISTRHPPPFPSLSSAVGSTVSHPLQPCPLVLSAAVSTVILGRRIRHQTSYPPSSSDVPIDILRRHVHRHPLPSPPVIRRRFHLYHPPPCPPSSAVVSIVILHRHVHHHPLPSRPVIRHRFHRYPPPSGSIVILCLQPCPLSSSGAVSATVIRRYQPPCPLSSAAVSIFIRTRPPMSIVILRCRVYCHPLPIHIFFILHLSLY